MGFLSSLRRLVRPELLESVRFYPLVVESAERVLVIGRDMARQLGPVEIV